ncbi:MAG: hypothetical protein GXY86_15930 [Firmicutes bacterium]|nr:hypothetical protein [Bacillota bacterium]
MNKEIILLAASEKYRNYCIAGIDTSTGEWVRIISEDTSICGAVRKEDMQYEDGTFPEILDIIKIRCKKYQPSKHQPENYIFDNQIYWERRGKSTIRNVLRIHPINQKEYIFFDTNKKIQKDRLSQIPQTEVYSLILISVQTPIITVKQWPERKDITMNFIYKSNQYSYISITAIDYKNRYLKQEEGSYRLPDNTFLVISLGECYDKDDCHYKLIATIIEKDS